MEKNIFAARRAAQDCPPERIAERRGRVLYDKKWRKFLRRARLFRHIPFIDFVLAAGSMAIGNVSKDSDFDVIVGARRGRIFTARFFAVALYGAFGWRREKMSHRDDAADKICMNHFVTDRAYRLSEPHPPYWRELYQNLVPVFGPVESAQAFLAANSDWMGREPAAKSDLRHGAGKSSLLKRAGEAFLRGRAGDCAERILRRVQIQRIERSLVSDPPGYKPRIRYGDDELEFHPDTKRIEAYSKNMRRLKK